MFKHFQLWIDVKMGRSSDCSLETWQSFPIFGLPQRSIISWGAEVQGFMMILGARTVLGIHI
jgi:hypothetical protein